MSRIPGGRRAIAGLLASSLLLALAVLPASPFHSAARAAGEPSDCAYIEGEGSGTDWCQLVVEFPEQEYLICSEGCHLEVPAGESFTAEVRVMSSGYGHQITEGCAATVPITLTLYEDILTLTSLAPGDSTTESAVAGLATFTLSVAEPGTYYLAASVDDETCGNTFVDGYSDSFDVTESDNVTVCPEAEPCDAEVTSESGQTTATIHAGPGAVITAFFSTLEAAGFTACPDHPLVDPTGVLTFDVENSDESKTITFVVPAESNGKVCWNTDHPFTQRNGKPAAEDPASPGTYTGILPDCSKKSPAGPCVLKVTNPDKKASNPSKTLLVLAPPGDPKMY